MHHFSTQFSFFHLKTNLYLYLWCVGSLTALLFIITESWALTSMAPQRWLWGAAYQMWLEKSVSEPSCEDCKRGSTRQFSFTLWISFMTKISCFQCLNMNMQRPRTICLKEHPHWCFNLLSILSFTSFYLYKSICESLLQPVHSP